MIEPFALVPYKARLIALAVLVVSGLAAPVHAPAADWAQSAERPAYVLFTQGSRSTTMSGSAEDLRRAQALRTGGEALLYVRRGGNAYVIRDAATLLRAEAIFAPQEALGARQAQLGSRQSALGRRQSALGAEQGRLGRHQADASPRRQEALGRQQEALGRQQDELGRQQDALGRQQSALGREQERLAREADAKFRALLTEALRRGVAQRVN